eukprot:9782181-Alexandrium_andersonii.AAC.1
MSASLVGSEMCIRDRVSLGIELPPTPWATGRAQAAIRDAAWARPVAHGAVSYTHLTLPTICSV